MSDQPPACAYKKGEPNGTNLVRTDTFYIYLTVFIFTTNNEYPHRDLFHSDGFRKIAGLIDVGTAHAGGVIREQLQRHHVQDRG